MTAASVPTSRDDGVGVGVDTGVDHTPATVQVQRHRDLLAGLPGPSSPAAGPAGGGRCGECGDVDGYHFRCCSRHRVDYLT